MTAAANRTPLSAFRPLASMTDEQVTKMLRDAGMYAPAEDWRQGPGALAMRRDVTVSDAAEAAEAALNGALGVLRYLVCDESLYPAAGAAASSVMLACELLAGHLAVIRAGIWRAEVIAA